MPGNAARLEAVPSPIFPKLVMNNPASCDMTQQQLARILKVNQAAVSKMERRTDMYLSTLREFIRAMGGELKITATFPGGGQVEIKQFEQGKKAHAGG
jgi:transcriptional regulator with XRE-family HTH domain